MISFKKHPRKSASASHARPEGDIDFNSHVAAQTSSNNAQCNDRACAWRQLFQNEMPILPN